MAGIDLAAQEARPVSQRRFGGTVRAGVAEAADGAARERAVAAAPAAARRAGRGGLTACRQRSDRRRRREPPAPDHDQRRVWRNVDGLHPDVRNGNPFWTIAGNIAQSIFDGGTLFHRQRAAEATFEQAAAQYRSTVLTGFQNVADALYALQADADSLKAAVAAEQASRRTLDITLKQQELGAVSYLALLSARQAYQQALITRVQAQASRLADTAALFQALGGGWWNRPAAAPTSSKEAGR